VNAVRYVYTAAVLGTLYGVPAYLGALVVRRALRPLYRTKGTEMSTIVCAYCARAGHAMNTCPERTAHQADNDQTDAERKRDAETKG